ncbi:MAG: hypothetical protein ACRDSR_24220 [Pseudonocardiaceae bacterium]
MTAVVAGVAARRGLFMSMPHQAFREAVRRIDSAGCTSWLDPSGLGLSDGDLPALVDMLGNLTALTQLTLVGNQLSALPTGLGVLTELAVLGIAGNFRCRRRCWLLPPRE